MYFRNKEHNPPHIHAITQDYAAPFLIATGELMEGEFPFGNFFGILMKYSFEKFCEALDFEYIEPNKIVK